MKKRTPTLRMNFKSEAMALRNAIHRCHNKDHASYYNYGARGISVAEEWRAPNGFAAFLQHIGPRPSASYSIDRIDNDLGYQPGNVRWADRKTQQNNRRPGKKKVFDFGWGIGRSKDTGPGKGEWGKPSPLIPHDGRIQTLADWADELNMCPATIRNRLYRGLSPAEALDPCTSRAGIKYKPFNPTIH